MRIVCIILLLFTYPVHSKELYKQDLKECREFTSNSENLKKAHKNIACLRLAENNFHIAQYSVGLGYMYNNDSKSAESYLLKAANNNYTPAFLALGHLYSNSQVEKSINWYEKYHEKTTKSKDRGYAASLLAKIYLKSGSTEKFTHWFLACTKTKYKKCGIY